MGSSCRGQSTLIRICPISETSEMQMSWGPCFEPSYQFFGQSVDKLTKVCIYHSY